MKKSTNFSAEKGRRLKIFATIFAAIFALIALATGLALKNYGGGRTDLTQTTAAATAPTDTSKYWTDEAAWSAADKDFNNYTLSGSGSQEDPYLIQSEWDLAYLSWTIYTDNPILASHVSTYYYYSGIYFKQTADLDLSAYYWQPIGIFQLRDGTSAGRYFSGCYDGGSHTVSGVFTPAGEGDGYRYQGLFGRVSGQSSTNKATISNVGVIDSFVQGYDSVGGVVGCAYRGTVENCYNTGSVSGSSYIGGVIGDAEGGTVTNCYNTGSVSGSSDSVGGVVGLTHSGSTVTNCYNTGSVSEKYYVGGVAGRVEDATITNCYNTGSVSGSSIYVGGVVGTAYSSSTISNTYYGGDCTLNVGIGSGSGSAVKIDEPAEEWAKNQDWYSANAVNSDGSLVWSADSPWDFENVWKIVRAPDYISTNDGYPVLQSFVVNFSRVIYWTDETVWSAAGKDFNSYTLSGSGSQGDPYLIQNEWDLAYLSWTIYTNNPILASHVSSSRYYYSGIYFEQTADLDLSAYYWQPIGISRLRDGTSASRRFSGYYDGGSHTVSGVFTPAGEGDGYSYQGLFGFVGGQSSTNKATISNVGVIDSFVQGYNYVGGVVGFVSNNSTVENCCNTASVSGSRNSVGGVVGSTYISSSSSCTITNCYNTGSVEGSGDYVGGVVGSAYSSTVTNCYNTGSVSGEAFVGGVVGYAYSGSTIKNCYNTGWVSSSGDRVGGVVGSGSATNCYNTGSVSGSSGYVGGVVGSGSATNCYNTGSVSGSSGYVGGVVGYAYSSTVTNCYNTGSVSGEAFVGGVVGVTHSGSTVTNCYNTGSVSGSSSYVGGVVGYAYSGSTISNTYYGGDCTLDVGIGEGSGSAVKIDKPVEEWAKNQDWYSANAVNSDGSPVWNADSPWDFENVWKFVENAPDYATNNGYPVLQGVGGNNQVIYWTDEAVWSAAGKDFNNYTLSGSGGQDDPYLIQSEWDLAYLSWTIYTNNPIQANHGSNVYYYSGTYFKQTADLDLSAYYWQPIGILNLRDGTSANRYFSGYYDGGSHTVSGLFTPAGKSNGYSYQGLFGYVRGQSSTSKATISNVGVIDSFVQGYDYVGGVVGYGSATNCYNTGSVSGSNNVGGVVGSGSATNCYNTGSVNGLHYVGGVVGFGRNQTTTNCYNTGSVSGSTYVGGVVGLGLATNCYNTGSVEGNSDVGGVVGFIDSGTVTNCYNTGSVSGEEYVGGIVGTASNSSAVTNCGFEGVINGSSSVGAIVGDIYDSSSVVSNCYAVAESDSEISLVGSNSGSGTIENIVGIITSGGTSKKVYTGSDFSGFAWLNFDSSPVPKGLSWAGQFQEPPAEYAGNSNWILTKMQSEGWSAI